MYKVTGYFKDHKVVRHFVDLYDAIDFKDNVDAHYPIKLTMDKVFDMKEWVYDNWNAVMDYDKNPLRHIPDTNTRHMIMQVLAWMWCIAFSIIVGSWAVFGVSVVGHLVLLSAIAITVGTFETAKRNPKLFNLRPGYHSVSRTRQYMWVNGQKVVLDANDPGGEHE